jgi:hypothetical protein
MACQSETRSLAFATVGWPSGVDRKTESGSTRVLKFSYLLNQQGSLPALLISEDVNLWRQYAFAAVLVPEKVIRLQPVAIRSVHSQVLLQSQGISAKITKSFNEVIRSGNWQCRSESEPLV